jgi:Cu/Ag efflux pump CusA
LLETPHVGSVAQRIGRAELGDDTLGPHESEFDVSLKPQDHGDVQQIQGELRKTLAQFPGYDFSMNSFLTERINETLSGKQAELVIKIFGTDLDVLEREAQTVTGVLSRIGSAADVRVQSPGGLPQLNVQLIPRSWFSSAFVRSTCSTLYRRPIRDPPWRKFMMAAGSSMFR